MRQPLEKYWWSNWGKTFAYSPRKTFVVESLDDIVAAVQGSDRIRAVGGGWSFTAASLPFRLASEVDAVSLDEHRTSAIPNRVAAQQPQKALAGLGIEIPVDATPLLMDELVDTAADDETQKALGAGPPYDQPGGQGAFSYSPNPSRIGKMNALHGNDVDGSPLTNHVSDALTAPRGSGENRPNEIASKPANGRRGGTGKIYS